MDIGTTLLFSTLFGSIGLGYFMYGKKQQKLDTVVKILGHANPRRAWCNASVVCSLPSARDSRIMSRAIRPSKHNLLRTRYTLFCIFR